MEKFVEITYLFDFYQILLTDKQRELISQYYFEDLSLGELALTHEISRQSIFDTIKKAQHKLLDYEKKLGLWEKHRRLEALLLQLQTTTDAAEKALAEEQMTSIQAIKELTNQLLSEM